MTFGAMVRGFEREARAGRMLPFAVELDGRFVGQVTVSGIVWGSLRSGQIGYWVDRAVAGRGITPHGGGDDRGPLLLRARACTGSR